MNYRIHTIAQHETVETIAGAYFADPRRYTELVAANRLRYPYISTDPTDRLGEPLLTTELVTEFAGGFRLYLTDFDPAAIVEGNFVLLRGQGGFIGTSFYDIATIFGYGYLRRGVMVWSDAMRADFTPDGLAAFGTGTILYLTGAPTHAYAAGTGVSLYPDPTLARTQVLGPGDLLRIPTAENDGSSGAATYTDLFGTDLALTGGFLTMTGRDLALVSGVDNLSQALRRRLLAGTGELVHHPTYGNTTLDHLGENTQTFLPNAYAGTIAALLGDVRLVRVNQVRVAPNGDEVTVDAVVTVAGSRSAIALSPVVITSFGKAE